MPRLHEALTSRVLGYLDQILLAARIGSSGMPRVYRAKFGDEHLEIGVRWDCRNALPNMPTHMHGSLELYINELPSDMTTSVLAVEEFGNELVEVIREKFQLDKDAYIRPSTRVCKLQLEWLMEVPGFQQGVA